MISSACGVGGDAAATGGRAAEPSRRRTGQRLSRSSSNHLARARLVTIDEETIELAHEALITAWPRLRAWIEEDRGGGVSMSFVKDVVPGVRVFGMVMR
ncbi:MULTISPECIES: nSTAND1 domain-containing NTPase [unclassified Streptomyces]|uniref:nSTAND1 domain-containing NTPase n=1 Tax=Streptomyces sp. NPDC055082 TaxID=3365718 RepID=UPI0037CFF2D2